MTAEQFKALFEEQINKCRDVLIVKAKEYATSDRLHNFKVAAGMEGISPIRALAGMMAKHTVSIYDMCGSGQEYDKAMWDEKITDHINYLLLLKALIADTEPKGCTTCDARHCCPEGEKAIDAGEPLQLDDRIEMAVDNLKVVLALAPKAVMNDEEYWRGFNNGICRALIELGVGIEETGNLIR